jgi:phospholipid N-methyltransferase
MSPESIGAPGMLGRLVAERLRFARSFLREPRRVGAVLPTSRRTAEVMLVMAPKLGRARHVVELGAGTGPITREVLPRLAPDARFLVYELDTDLAAGLSTEFADPRVQVIADSAAKLEEHLAGERADVMFSALPFTSLPPELRSELLDVIRRVLADDGVLVVLQYSPFVERDLRRRFGRVERRFSPLNVPPAVLYACRP